MAETIDHPRHFASKLAMLCASLFLLLVGTAAAEADVFTVRDIQVYAEGKNADEARKTAMDQAYPLAFQALLQRLVVNEDLVGAPQMTRAEIEPLVASHEIETESIKKKSYSGSLAFTFKPDEVRTLLTNRGLRFTEAQSRPVVVLPVLGEGADARLWQDPNPWRLAWADYHGSDALVPLLVPLGELEDVVAADAPEALAGDERRIMDLASRYGTTDALVVQALVAGDPAAGGAGINVGAKGYGALASPPFAVSLQQNAGETEAQFYSRAVRAVAQRLDSDWKQANAVYYGTQSSLPVSVIIGSLQDWLIARKALESSPLVTGVQVIAINRSQADIVISYRGTIEQLRLGLAQQDLVLESGVGGWQLRLGTAAGGVEQRQLGSQ